LRFRIERSGRSLNDASAKAKFLQDVLDEIADIDEQLVLKTQIKEIDELLNINNEQMLTAEVQKRKRHRSNRPNKSLEREDFKSFNKEISRVEWAQYELLKLLLSEDEKLITYILEHLSLEEFTHPLLQQIAEMFFGVLTNQSVLPTTEAFDLISENDQMDEETHQELQRIITRMIFELDESETVLRKEKMARDCLLRLELSDLQRTIDAINEKLHTSGGAESKTFELLKERQSLEKMKSEIKDKYQN